MNMASSRSHCIFTVTIESRGMGSDVIRRSKFNLVDLAGSERVHKTQADGQLLREAKHINLSLHYLEQCIVALSEKRPHIPYRNSMMTSVLRDSLGGNCKTAMIATVSAEQRNMDEAISTCRFAQRVAMVKNEATINESLDPHLMIKRLKQENRELREEIAMLNGEAADRGDAAIGEEEIARLRELVRVYIADTDDNAKLAVNDLAKIRATFSIMKGLIRDGSARPSTGVGVASSAAGSGTLSGVTAGDGSDGQLETLKLQLQQRDNEINILVAMLNKRGDGSSTAQSTQEANTTSKPGTPGIEAPAFTSGGNRPRGNGGEPEPEQEVSGSSALNLHMLDGTDSTGDQGLQMRTCVCCQYSFSFTCVCVDATADELVNTDLLRDRNQAFEHFRKSYRKNEAIEENKAILKEKYTAAKQLAAQVNGSRKQITYLKGTIEQLRKERAMQGFVDGEATATEEDPEEERAKAQVVCK